MNNLDVWLTIGLMTAANIITRCSFFLLGDAVKLPARVQHGLRYAPAVALAAIIAPDLLLVGTGAAAHWTLLSPKLLAAASAAVFFLTTRHMLGTITVGMVIYTVLRQFI